MSRTQKMSFIFLFLMTIFIINFYANVNAGQTRPRSNSKATNTTVATIPKEDVEVLNKLVSETNQASNNLEQAKQRATEIVNAALAIQQSSQMRLEAYKQKCGRLYGFDPDESEFEATVDGTLLVKPKPKTKDNKDKIENKGD